MFNLATYIFVLYTKDQPQKCSSNEILRAFPLKLEYKKFFFLSIFPFFQLYLKHGRPLINVKKLCHKKREQSKVKNQSQGNFFTFTLQFLTFCDSFMLVQRAFFGGSTMLLDINLVHN